MGSTMPPIPQAAHLVAYGQTLASVQSLPGVRVQAEASADGIVGQIVVAGGESTKHKVVTTSA